MKKKKTKYIDPDALRAGDELDRLVAVGVFEPHWRDSKNSDWFVKGKKHDQAHYFGPKFSQDMSYAVEALTFYYKHTNGILSYRLDHQMEEGPYSCTAELRMMPEIPDGGVHYVRAWAPTLPLAISRMLVKATIKT